MPKHAPMQTRGGRVWHLTTPVSVNSPSPERIRDEVRWTRELADRPGFLIFSEPYLLLTGRPAWGRPYEKPDNPPPGFGIANVPQV